MTFEDRFCDNVRYYRRRSGLSQDTVAVRASLHPHTVGKLEAGESIPLLDTLIRLAGALSTTPDNLLDGIVWRPGFVGDGPGRYRLDPGDEG